MRNPFDHKDGETRDMPFFKNDMKDQPTTTGKPLDSADGAGKADAEMAEDELAPPLGSASRS